MMKHLMSALVLVLLAAFDLSAQATGTVTGRVVDASSGQPVVGAQVHVVETTLGTVTDQSGRYTITGVPQGQHRMQVDFIGYAPQTRVVASAPGATVTADFSLTASALAIEGITVDVGYGTQDKGEITGSVATVTADDIDNSTAVTVAGALVGKIPGVLTRQPQGIPGEAPSFEIRNLGTPLFVVDGLPTTEGSFNNLDPSTIESISVLKDAAAASVYGVRAANGVVVVTTKRGSRGTGSRINVRTYAGWQNFTRFPKFADAATFVRAKAEIDMNERGRTNWTPEELALWAEGTQQGYRGFDWYDFTVQENAPQNYLSVSTSGGSDEIDYFVSVARTKQDALYIDSDFKRTNLLANVNASIGRGLSIGVRTQARIEDRNNPGIQGGNDFAFDIGRPIQGIFQNSPLQHAYANDNPLYPGHTDNAQLNPAAYADGNGGYQADQWRALNVLLQATYEFPVDGLTATAKYANYQADHLRNNFEYAYKLYTYHPDTDTYEATSGRDVGRRQRDNDRVTNQTLQFLVNYDHDFGVHGVGLDLAFERSDEHETGYNLTAQPTTNFIDLIKFNELTGMGDTDTESARMGYILRANYDYDGRYLLQVSGRYDGSWRFTPEHRWGLFPAVSAGWRLSEESFYQNSGISNLVSNVMLRASHGQTGTDRIGPAAFAYLQGYDFGAGRSVFDGSVVTGISPRGLPVTNFSWVRSTMTNAGIDLGFLDNSLQATVEVFNRERSGLPAARWDVLIPNEVAIDLPDENLNSDANRGIEGSLSYANAKRAKVHYSLGTNMTVARRKTLQTYKPRFSNSWDEYRTSVENRWTDIDWGYRVVGRFQTQEEIDSYPVDVDRKSNTTLRPGDFIYEDVNGDGVVNAQDSRPIGYSEAGLPNVSFGGHASVAYAGIDLTLDFAGAAAQTYRSRAEMQVPLWNGSNAPEFLLNDRWHRAELFDPTSEWIPGKYPALTDDNGHNNNQVNDFWVNNVRYLRLKNAELGFRVPKRLLDRVGGRNMRIYVNGTNLLTWDTLADRGLDPEADRLDGRAYPQMRTVVIGADVGI